MEMAKARTVALWVFPLVNLYSSVQTLAFGINTKTDRITEHILTTVTTHNRVFVTDWQWTTSELFAGCCMRPRHTTTKFETLELGK